MRRGKDGERKRRNGCEDHLDFVLSVRPPPPPAERHDTLDSQTLEM